jgi:hypothetical protein
MFSVNNKLKMSFFFKKKSYFSSQTSGWILDTYRQRIVFFYVQEIEADDTSTPLTKKILKAPTRPFYG